MRAILDVILFLLNIATWIIIVQAVMSWLVAFNVLSIQNPTVRSIWSGLERITEPVYAPIRRRAVPTSKSASAPFRRTARPMRLSKNCSPSISACRSQPSG